MIDNDLPVTEYILAAEAKLREIRDANRSGAFHEVTELADQLGKISNKLRARSIFLHFKKPMKEWLYPVLKKPA